jgi:hypothetical protein
VAIATTLEFQTQSTAKSTPLRYFNKKDTADILLLCRFIMHVGHEITSRHASFANS